VSNIEYKNTIIKFIYDVMFYFPFIAFTFMMILLNKVKYLLKKEELNEANTFLYKNIKSYLIFANSFIVFTAILFINYLVTKFSNYYLMLGFELLLGLSVGITGLISILTIYPVINKLNKYSQGIINQKTLIITKILKIFLSLIILNIIGYYAVEGYLEHMSIERNEKIINAFNYMKIDTTEIVKKELQPPHYIYVN
jgi:hypothetical protein